MDPTRLENAIHPGSARDACRSDHCTLDALPPRRHPLIRYAEKALSCKVSRACQRSPDASRSSAYLETWASPSRIVRSKPSRRSVRRIMHRFTPLGAGRIDISVRCLPSPYTGSGNNVGHHCSTFACKVGSDCRQLPRVGGERKIELPEGFL